MRGTGAGEPPGLGFDHAAEAIPPQGALLLKVDPDLLHGLVGTTWFQWAPCKLGKNEKAKDRAELLTRKSRFGPSAPPTMLRAIEGGKGNE